MPNNPAYSSVDGVPVNYIPGDWPETAAVQAANEEAFTSGEGQELSSAVQITEAAQAALGVSGDDRSWKNEVPAVEVAAPSALTPDIQGKQKTLTPYAHYLYM